MTIDGVKLLISELRKVKVLGHGSSGLVEKAVHDSTGIVVSIKVKYLFLNYFIKLTFNSAFVIFIRVFPY